jgi:hypothetical protein
MSGGNLEKPSECCSNRCWQAGEAARHVSFRDLSSSFQFGVLLIENQHLVGVREVNLDEQQGSIRSADIDNRHVVIVVGTLASSAFTVECHSAVITLAPFDSAFRGEDNPVMLQEWHGGLRAMSFTLDSVFTCAQGCLALNEPRESGERRFVSAFDFAIICTGLGDAAQAFKWLQKACEVPSFSMLMSLKGEPRFDTLRSDPRFQDLLRQVGLPPQCLATYKLYKSPSLSG